MALFGVPAGAPRRRPPCRQRRPRAAPTVVDACVASSERGPRAQLRMHTGINTGLVVARRSDARAGDYALTGDAVNTAARLRSLAGPDEVVVSAETWRQVADFFEADASAPIEVKGKEQPLVAYRVRRARGRRRRRRGGSLVGRDEELRDFRALAEACAERKRSRVVIVRGDPGVGKSRLVAEFVAAARSLGFSCHAAAVLDFGAETGRDAVRSLARSLLGVPRHEPTRRPGATRSSAPSAARPIGCRSGASSCTTCSTSRRRPSCARSPRRSAPRRAKRARCRRCATWRRRAAQRDAAAPRRRGHPLGRRLDARAPRRARRARRPAAAAARDDDALRRRSDAPAPGARSLHGAPLLGIDLGPLSADESLRLASQASAIVPALVASCVERAEGNPLFLLQLLLNAGEAAQSSLPGSIQALVHTRMDRLAAADKFALQAAAVLGQRYTVEALRHLIDDAGLRLPPAGRALPGPRRRQRVHVLPRADPRRRLRVAAAQAPPRPARARRRMVRDARPGARRRALRPRRRSARRPRLSRRERGPGRAVSSPGRAGAGRARPGARRRAGDRASRC